jgi:serine/threonine-protein kinase
MSAGTEFAGYRITGILGHGGMSVVYVAEHLSLGRTVALKVLSTWLGEDEAFRERFIRESKLAAALEHPNIIPIYDAGESNGVLYIAMRHVAGGDLGTRIKQNGPLSLGQTIFYLEQVAGALDQAHSEGLVHRDVKPGNILIENTSDRVYLTDFGVVKQSTAPGLTKTGHFLGTFAYAAPEQIERKPIDGRTDIYALGCVLHECLSGTPPFDAETEASMLHAHLAEPPPKLTDSRPDLPHSINAVLATAMAKAKEDRYASAADMVRALRSVALGTGATSPALAAQVAAAGATGATATGAPATVLSTSEVAAAVAAAPVAAAAAAPEATATPEAPGAPPPAPPPVASEPPAAQTPPPPTGGAAAPPAGDSGRGGGKSITLTGKTIALALAGLAALVAIAIVATILLTNNNSSNSASGTTGKTSTQVTTGASGAVGPVEIGFAGVVPNALLKFCTPATTPSAGAAATVDCKPPADTAGHYYPNSWTMSLYATDAELNKAYNGVRNAANVGTNYGQCNGISWGGEGTWAHGPGKPGGKRLCYFDGNVAVVAWTHEAFGQPTHINLLGIARSDGSDHSDLFNWYRFWHHRVGKCDQVNCVAKLS